MKVRFFFYLLFFPTVFQSCLIPIASIRKFEIFKNPVLNNPIKNEIQYNGVYLSPNKHEGLVFYHDGKIKFLVGYEIIGLLEMHESEIKKTYPYEYSSDWHSKEFWGEYSMSSSEIRSEEFWYNNTDFVVRTVFARNGILIDDSTLIVNSLIDQFDNIELLKEPVVYKFQRSVS